MSSSAPTKGTSDAPDDRVAEVVRRYWGYDTLRPLQAEAITAGLDRRDSLVVLPTGGGKSLCYQVPPLLAERTDVVVSPLISLMKDQVDALRACGYPAAALHSGLDPGDRTRIENEIAGGRYRLVLVAPERVLSPGFLQLIERLEVRGFAVDEAHCISHWGHDFRPEYRQLATLKQRFPGASIHAYTATATERVRADIIEQLGLQDPAVLVGCFDRPNLVYRVLPLQDRQAQALEVVRRHAGEAVIVYCISRKDTEHMAAYLQANGVRAAAYHAGLHAAERRRTQDAFSAESLDVVAATVAFGMGIDRSNVRSVIHAAMPKSVEHYQQETGRAGRDGLEAECVLLYSAADAIRWESLIRRSAAEAEAPPEVAEAAEQLLAQMRRYCASAVCRHRALSEHFGQAYERTDCGACDVCLDEVEGVADATVNAQKILSCVARVEERFGVGYVVEVLRGADTERIRRIGHDRLSTFGLLKDHNAKAVQSMVYQLIDQGLLARTDGDKPVLRLNQGSWAVMRGEREVRFIQPKSTVTAKTKIDDESWEGVDRGLFEHLRAVRRELAEERGVPPYVILGDVTLRAMARQRPGSLEALLAVKGIGQTKLADFGRRFLEAILSYCREHGLPVEAAGHTPRFEPVIRKRTQSSLEAEKMFARGLSIDEVMTTMGRARTTTVKYLVEYIRARRPADLDHWVEPAGYHEGADAAQETGTRYIRPIYDRLDGRVPHDIIRLVVTHLEGEQPTD
ncbi:MAG: DNA helicase RecQ [bacterium]|nr:DNA helicase RecQ [bacterium]